MGKLKVGHIAGFLVFIACLVTFGLYATRCHGSECEIVSTEIKGGNIDTTETNSKRIAEQLRKGEIVLLDVREESEWNEGHIAGAKHIPLNNLDITTTESIDRAIPLYIYCRSGKRAKEAEDKLKELGFSRAESIGGVIDWQENGGELVK